MAYNQQVVGFESLNARPQGSHQGRQEGTGRPEGGHGEERPGGRAGRTASDRAPSPGSERAAGRWGTYRQSEVVVGIIRFRALVTNTA